MVRGTPPGVRFDPATVTEEYAGLLKYYRIYSVTGDHYAAAWVSSAWSKHGVTYRQSNLAKSAIYLECDPLFARGLVRLPNHAKLLRELRLLERRVHRSGKDWSTTAATDTMTTRTPSAVFCSCSPATPTGTPWKGRSAIDTEPAPVRSPIPTTMTREPCERITGPVRLIP